MHCSCLFVHDARVFWYLCTRDVAKNDIINDHVFLCRSARVCMRWRTLSRERTIQMLHVMELVRVPTFYLQVVSTSMHAHTSWVHARTHARTHSLTLISPPVFSLYLSISITVSSPTLSMSVSFPSLSSPSKYLSSPCVFLFPSLSFLSLSLSFPYLSSSLFLSRLSLPSPFLSLLLLYLYPSLHLDISLFSLAPPLVSPPSVSLQMTFMPKLHSHCASRAPVLFTSVNDASFHQNI